MLNELQLSAGTFTCMNPFDMGKERLGLIEKWGIIVRFSVYEGWVNAKILTVFRVKQLVHFGF
jgi:hypothetical protein